MEPLKIIRRRCLPPPPQHYSHNFDERLDFPKFLSLYLVSELSSQVGWLAVPLEHATPKMPTSQ